MTKERKAAIILVIILIVGAALSFFPASKKLSDPETYKETIEYLEEKEKQIDIGDIE